MDVFKTDLTEETLTSHATTYTDHIDDTDDDFINTTKSTGFRCFQVFKSTSLGLGAPQGYKLDVKTVDPIGRHSQSLCRTTDLFWARQGFFLPPNFKIHRSPADKWAGLTKEYGPLIASVKYRGMEGFFRMTADLSVFRDSKDLDTFSNEIPLQQRHQLRIRRGGWARHYNVAAPNSPGTEHIWKGTKFFLNGLIDSAPDCNGNLKLIKEDSRKARILAVWKNRTDPKILGALWINESALEAGEIVLEDVLCSCLAIVCSERLNGRGWLGGATHSRSRSRPGFVVT